MLKRIILLSLFFFIMFFTIVISATNNYQYLETYFTNRDFYFSADIDKIRIKEQEKNDCIFKAFSYYVSILNYKQTGVYNNFDEEYFIKYAGFNLEKNGITVQEFLGSYTNFKKQYTEMDLPSLSFLNYNNNEQVIRKIQEINAPVMIILKDILLEKIKDGIISIDDFTNNGINHSMLAIGYTDREELILINSWGDESPILLMENNKNIVGLIVADRGSQDKIVFNLNNDTALFYENGEQYKLEWTEIDNEVYLSLDWLHNTYRYSVSFNVYNFCLNFYSPVIKDFVFGIDFLNEVIYTENNKIDTKIIFDQWHYYLSLEDISELLDLDISSNGKEIITIKNN